MAYRKNVIDEVNMPEDLKKKYEAYYNESKMTLSKLDLRDKIDCQIENSSKWIWRTLLKLFIEALANNIK